MFFITTHTECKNEAEKIIARQFREIECAICCAAIDNNKKGYIYITCNGAADLEHIFCTDCDAKFTHTDPYKRKIVYKFQYPFINNEHARAFLDKSDTFILNVGEDNLVRNFTKEIKKAVTDSYQDLELSFRLFD
ncbi:hypothetical protein [Epinotia aporema granulovirus]|uniref:Uncharacterized protein n=1 Tax=Epinotia aporema granulovirus TaxID=166056 RepID=K4ERV6_9BBAC|nr:hypothetical protein [Epinotia aporema granulovirus]AER41550.1 hypothetical protein [Epinotia aporema granulovirus]